MPGPDPATTPGATLSRTCNDSRDAILRLLKETTGTLASMDQRDPSPTGWWAPGQITDRPANPRGWMPLEPAPTAAPTRMLPHGPGRPSRADIGRHLGRLKRLSVIGSVAAFGAAAALVVAHPVGSAATPATTPPDATLNGGSASGQGPEDGVGLFGSDDDSGQAQITNPSRHHRDHNGGNFFGSGAQPPTTGGFGSMPNLGSGGS